MSDSSKPTEKEQLEKSLGAGEYSYANSKDWTEFLKPQTLAHNMEMLASGLRSGTSSVEGAARVLDIWAQIVRGNISG